MKSKLFSVAILVVAVTAPARAELRPVVADPERAPRVFSRRWFELSAHGAGAVRECASGCDAVDLFGYAAGFTALFRPARGYAVGVGWDRAWFHWQPEGIDALTAHVSFFRLLARLYLVDSRRMDFWLEASLNQSTWGASRRVKPPPWVIGTGTGMGLDVFVWDHLKVGPRAQVNWTLVGRECTEGCGSGGTNGEPLEAPDINVVLQFGLAITVPFGPSLQ